MHFKGDGELERCNDCKEITFASEKKCGLYNIHYTFDAVGIERAESFLLEHVFKVKSVDELNQYQKDVFRTIELMEVCDCNE
jgi:exoribonuclease II